MSKWQLWLTRPLLCKLGLHKESAGNWGYGFGGIVDIFCARCQKLIASFPLDDVPPSLRDTVTETIELMP